MWGEEEAKTWFMDPMYSKETAEYLEVSMYKLHKWVKEDKIPYIRIDNNKLLFHKTIIDAWKESKFQNGRVELILDEITIDYDHGEALRDHYNRYPELIKKKQDEDGISKPIAHSDIKYKIADEGVYLTIGDQNSVEVTICLSHTALDELYSDVSNFRTNK